jgi:hypothetical protein|tara:strand:- start:582 stop:866 length:285 start_codon:yes stop_codon:yes gene_type:complete
MLKMTLSIFIMMMLVAVSSFARPLSVGLQSPAIDQSVNSGNYAVTVSSHQAHVRSSQHKRLQAQPYNKNISKLSQKAKREATSALMLASYYFQH